MIRSDLILYSILAVAGVAGAYWASMPVDKSLQNKVVVRDFGKLTLLAAEGKQQNLQVRQEGDNRYLITVFATIDGSETSSEEFVADRRVGDIFRLLSPLRAERSLGTVSDEQLVEFGLQDPQMVLLVGEGENAKRLAFGNNSFGTRFRYFRVGDEKQVFLVDYGPFGELMQAKQTLMERNPFGREIKDLTHIRATVGESGSVDFYNVQKDVTKPAAWAGDRQAREGKELYNNIVDMISKITIDTYLTGDDLAAVEFEAELLNLNLTDKKSQTTSVSIKKFETAGNGQKAEVRYALMSSYVGRYVRISTNRAMMIIDELTKLLAKPEE